MMDDVLRFVDDGLCSSQKQRARAATGPSQLVTELRKKVRRGGVRRFLSTLGGRRRETASSTVGGYIIRQAQQASTTSLTRSGDAQELGRARPMVR